MMPFENMITEKGFVRHSFDHKTRSWISTERYCYSTMADLIYAYIHPDGRRIDFGLNQKDHPPGLCFPRPKILAKLRTKDGKVIDTHAQTFDACMERVSEKYSPEEIFEAIYDRNKEFVIDMTDANLL